MQTETFSMMTTYKPRYNFKKLPTVFIFAYFLFCSINAFSQTPLFYNNGSPIFASAGSLIHIDGTTENANNGNINNQGGAITITNGHLWNNSMDTIINQGLINIRGDFKNDGYTNMSPNGIFNLSGDWINNGVFISGGGTAKVYLDGTTQNIRGTAISVFRDLELQNNAVKTLQINAAVSGVLTLNDCELATDVYSMTLLSTNNTAVTRTSGFVSSLGAGSLEWAVIAGTTYEFPTGSSLITTRFRPVGLTPAANGRLGVRMVNNDATNDGLATATIDNVTCGVNNLYYHRIHSNITMNADVAIAFDPAQDGSWTNMANWSNSQWTDMGGANSVLVSSMQAVKINQWSKLNSLYPAESYILSKIRPIPSISGADVCENQSGKYSAVNPDAGSTYTWTVTPAGTGFTANASDVDVNWGSTGAGTVSVVQTAANGCASHPVSFNVNINANPLADFKPIPSPATAGEVVNFQDLSTGASSYHWDFGNTESSGDTSNAVSPSYLYDNAGHYIIKLDVTSSKGCKSTKIFDYLDVLPGIIPNVVTVNSDGINDFFHIKGFSEYHILIYNRWGERIFESADKREWDGKTESGDPVAAGVYYYILTPKSGKVHTGHVTIVK